MQWGKLLTENGLIASKPEFLTNEFGTCLQRRVNCFLFLKLPTYLCFQEMKRSFQFSGRGGGGGGGGAREGEVNEIPNLGRVGAFEEKVGNGLGC
jgi:hypothetical protein